MSLEKVSVIDSTNVKETGVIEVRRADKIIENGKEISKTYHRHVLAPGASIDGEDERVVAIANVVWTQEVIDAYQASQVE